MSNKRTLTGQDTIIIDNDILADFADGDVGVLEYENNMAEIKTGKNGNSIYALNETGSQAKLTIRVLRGSADDVKLNARLAQQSNNFPGFVLLNGQVIKKIGDGSGAVKSDTYILGGGIFMKRVDTKSNVEGDVEQSVSVYTMMFANAPRAIR